MTQKIKNYEHYLAIKTSKSDDDREKIEEEKKNIYELQRDIEDMINSFFLISRELREKNIEKLLARSRRAQRKKF